MELRGENFHHPYSPYNIQLQFMRALYECIENKKVGIFESPTGKALLISSSSVEVQILTLGLGTVSGNLSSAYRWSLYHLIETHLL